MSSGEITARFGAAVRSLRFRLGWSQEALAERADLHRTYIAGIERGGRNITLKSAARLAEALGVSMAEMLGAEAEALAVNCAPARPRIGGKIVDILLVEDNPDDAMLALSGFREMHISNHVHVVTDATKALDYLLGERLEGNRHAANLPQLILLDLQLPDRSGFEVLRRVKQNPRVRAIPVIVLALSADGRDILESRRLGADGYIIKPLNFHNLSQATPQLKFRLALFEPPKPMRA